jgi:transposase
MDDFIKMLDKSLDYMSHEIKGDFIFITVKSNRQELNCTYCGTPSSKIHSTYPRTFQDLPIMGKKAIIMIDNRKMFCGNPGCGHKTFAEIFSFLGEKARRTNRLEDEILRVSLNCSSIAASKQLSENTAIIGKSAICKLLKKNRT